MPGIPETYSEMFFQTGLLLEKEIFMISASSTSYLNLHLTSIIMVVVNLSFEVDKLKRTCTTISISSLMENRFHRALRHTLGILTLLFVILGILIGGESVKGNAVYGATAIPQYHKIPAYQMKDIYSDQKVNIGSMSVYDGDKSSDSLVSDEITFTIYNSTLQKVECKVTTVDGKLPELKLTEDYNYIIFLLDDENGTANAWRMNNKYVWVHGGKLYDIKKYESNLQSLKKDKGSDYEPTEADRIKCYGDPITSLRVFGKNGEEHPDRVDASTNTPAKANLPANQNDIGNIFVYYDGKPVGEGIEIVFTSDRETIRAKTDAQGRVHPSLLEDVNYMVSTEDSRYEIDPFPIAGKDKSEYDAGRYFYDHSSCHRVGLRYEVAQQGKYGSTWVVEPTSLDEINPIVLVDKGKAHQHDTTITSLSGKTTAGGMNFKDIILMDRTVNESVADLSGKDYQLLDITPVNPHRGEVCKLATGDYTIQESAYGRKVDSVYEVDESGNVKALEFSQSGNQVQFHMTSLGICRIALVYNSSVTPSLRLSSKTYTYDGKVKKPSVTVKVGEQTLSASDYTMAYSSGCKAVGTYSVTVTLNGNRQGSNKASYQILPKGTSLKKVKGIRKGFKVTWRKQGTQTTGYQIQYSRFEKFTKGNKITTVTKAKTTSKSVKKLTRKKKYYLRVRTYKKVNGKKYYSGWSKAKSIKTK